MLTLKNSKEKGDEFMRIIEIIKNFFKKLKKDKNQLLLNSPKDIKCENIALDKNIEKNKNCGIKRGIYTKGVLNLLKNDIENPETLKKYILKEKEVPKEEYLEYKLDYIFENINKYTDYNNSNEEMDDKKYYINIEKELLNDEELFRINTYLIPDKENNENITLLKIKPTNNKVNKENVFYILNRVKNTFMKKTNIEMIEILERLKRESKEIIEITN